MIGTLLSPLADLTLDALNVPNAPPPRLSVILRHRVRIIPTFLSSPSVLTSAVIAGSPKALLGTMSFTLVIIYALGSQCTESRS